MSDPGNRVPQLPHAAPFLLLDRVLEVHEDRGAFLKLVSAADPNVVAGGRLPAAFVLEAIAQAGGALLAALGRGPGGYLMSVEGFRMHRDVRVGDELRVEVSIVRTFGPAVVFQGQALVDGEPRAEMRFKLALPR